MDKKAKKHQIVEPVFEMVLVCLDDEKGVTSGGIVLPDSCKIPMLTGRIVRLPEKLKDDIDCPFEELDKIIYNPGNSIPIDLEQGNKQYLIPIKGIYAIIREGDES